VGGRLTGTLKISYDPGYGTGILRNKARIEPNIKAAKIIPTIINSSLAGADNALISLGFIHQS